MATNKTKASKINIFGIIFLGLFISGVILVFLSTYVKDRRTILSFDKVPAPLIKTIEISNEKNTKPTKIAIEDIGIDLDIEDGKIVNGIWEISEDKASFLVASAKPRQGGNIVIYGHNKKDIFGKLITSARTGQVIDIYSQDGEGYKYKITEVTIVNPSEINVVSPTDFEVLTVYTCTGFLDTKRLVIKAFPVEIN